MDIVQSDIKDVCQGAQLLVVNELFRSPNYHEPVDGEVAQDPRELTMADFKDIKARKKTKCLDRKYSRIS